MYYTIYKITNNINQKVYLGKHVTSNLEDDYLGSGIAINAAISKYGIENFTKEIIHIFDTEDKLNSKEKELVTEEFCLRKDTYNICVGGNGGKIVLFPEHPLYEEVKKKISNSQKARSEISRQNAIKYHQEKRIGMYGRKQSDTQKKAVSKAQKGRTKTSEEIKKRLNSYNRTINADGYVHPNKGRKRPDAVTLAKNLPRKKCKYCGFETNAGNHARYHGEKCKHKLDM